MRKLFDVKTVVIGVLILFVGIVVRTIFLDRVPAGLKDDELNFILTAKSVYLTGKTLDGTFAPLSLQPVPVTTDAPSARAPYILQAPIIGILPLGLFTSKIGYALISIMTIVIWYFIALRFWGKTIALITAGVLALNPWAIHLGRTAFDAPVSVFLGYTFFCFALYLEGWWLLLACLPWAVGLFAYHGINIIYPALLCIGCLGSWFIRKRVYTRQYVTIIVIGLCLFLLFILSAASDRFGTRMHEIITPNNPGIIASVNTERRNSIQSPINIIFINKLTVSVREILGKYLSSFSTIHLFVSGESEAVYSLRTLGFFYPLDFFLLLIGIVYAILKYRTKTLIFLSLLLVSPIPTALSITDTSYAQRSALMFPIFCMFISLGIFSILQIKKLAFLWKLCLLLVYTISFLYFLHVYFFQNPVNNSEAFGFSNRILANYMRKASKGQTVEFIGNGSINVFRQYLFYSDALNRNTISNIQSMIYSGQLKMNTTDFMECPKSSFTPPATSVVIVPFAAKCDAVDIMSTQTPLAITYLSDSGRIYEIYNDTLCSQYELSEYQKPITFTDLAVESMSDKQFCQTYISRPRMTQEKTL